MLVLVSSRKQWVLFQYVVTAHLISSGCVSINVVDAVSLNSGCGFPDVLTSLF